MSGADTAARCVLPSGFRPLARSLYSAGEITTIVELSPFFSSSFSSLPPACPALVACPADVGFLGTLELRAVFSGCV